MGRHVARIGEKRNTYILLVEQAEGKRPLARPRRRWVDNIKMELGVVWTVLMWLRIGSSVWLL
jgi:hypothetical protein